MILQRRPGRAHLLVVDDEESYRTALEIGLGAEGYEVRTVEDGRSCLAAVEHEPVDLVVLDMMLPDLPGLEICRRLAATGLPVVVVSARCAEVDVVAGLEVGAADYLTKPFHLRELVARIEAVLRRTCSADRRCGVLASPGDPVPVGAAVVDVEELSPRVVQVGPIEVDLVSREVRLSGRPVALTRRELELVEILASPPGRLRSREELLARLWGDQELVDDRTLDAHMRRLRRKLEPDPANPRYLQTVRGVGFRLDEPDGSSALGA
ncbi:response regulator transcription factor [Aciditerrimonas ferrireducens]|uniref:Response regulator transcription factor n=1 Tax=Aciditerrimonas ferrireducens TaxID=667306 RepID=A0ABV6BZ93_9ACTN|nr:response regulator transcription factor [Aciditerrimonas ferrireducens]MCK4177269.1 response regulator transcription factor [Aciditerrimonas ferrireducens]